MDSHAASGWGGGLRRPLIGLSVAFIAGLQAGARPFPASFAAALWGVGLGLSAFAALRRRRRGATVALLSAVFIAGVLRMRLAEPGWSPRDVSRLAGTAREALEVVGVIEADPVLRESSPGRAVRQFPLRVEGVRRTMAWQRASGRLQVRLSDDAAAGRPLSYGDRCLFSGPVFAALASRARGMSGAMSARPDTWRRLSSGHRNPLLRACASGRRACRTILRRGLDDFPSEAAIYEALLLGYREGIPDDVNETFRATGTLHIFAISGLHVGMVVTLLVFLVRATGWSKTSWAIALVPALAVYTGATGLEPSAVRACVMASCFWAALLIGRRPDLPSSLAFAALAILVSDPYALFDPGFVYSFSIVAGLIVLYPPLRRRVLRALDADPWSLPSEPLPRRMLRRAAIGLATMLVTSFVALVVSLPLTALFANLVSPASLVGNLAAIPGSFLIVLSGALSLAVGAVSSAGSEIFNHAARAMAGALIAIMRALAAAPGAQWVVRSPPVLALAAYYGALGAALLFPGRPRRWIAGTGAGAIAAAAILGLADRRCTMEWAGEGLAPTAWIDVPGGRDVLIDPGPSWRAGGVVRFLRARGVDRLRAVLVTQPLADRAGALPEVLRRIPAAEVWCPAATARSAPYRRALDEARAMGAAVRELSAGDRLTLDGDVAIDVWHPRRGKPCADAGTAALVLRIAGAGCSVAILGPFRDEARLSLASSPAARADAVVIEAPPSPATLDAVQGLLRPRQIWVGGSDASDDGAGPAPGDGGDNPPARRIGAEGFRIRLDGPAPDDAVSGRPRSSVPRPAP